MVNTEETFVERVGKEASETIRDGVTASMGPFAVIFERIKPLVMHEIGRKFIQPITRPIMSPRRLRWT